MLSEVLKGHKKISLDTMLFIHFFEGGSPYDLKVEELLREVQSGEKQACTTVVTLSELLVKPLREKEFDLASDYKNTLNSFPHLEVLEINQHIAVMAATMKAKYKIKLPDALQIAGAYIGGADLFITNDKQMKKIEELKVVTLDQL